MLGALPTLVFAEVSLAPVFGDHMVLQRQKPVRIWGSAQSGEKITVRFRDQEKQAVADVSGGWSVVLDPLSVGPPASLEVTGSNALTLTDVLVGEVWLGGGQSNMENPTSLFIAKDKVLAAAAEGTYGDLRLMQVKDGQTGRWQQADPTATSNFPALLFFFGLRLQQELKMPVGLIGSAQGGTSAIQWIDEDTYRSSAECREAIAAFASTYSFAKEKQEYDVALSKWQEEKQKNPNLDPGSEPKYPRQPGELRRDTVIGEHFRANILPLIPFTIRGIVWDQGESGTGIFGLDHYQTLSLIIGDWRKKWGEAELPFLFTQKPNGGGSSRKGTEGLAPLPDKPPGLTDGLVREAYFRVLSLPATGMAITSDLGGGIHPDDKADYGERLSRVALKVVYERPLAIYGPTYRSFVIEDSRMRVFFDHAGKGLATVAGEPVRGFAIAGADGKFRWADARIEGDSVVLSSDKVKRPVAVQYAWSNTPGWANLFNDEGLPAMAFRTDTPAAKKRESSPKD